MWAVHSSAVTLEEIAKDQTLKVKDSKGPKHRKVLEDHAFDEWENEEDLNNLIDDGLIHDAYEDKSCEPKGVYKVDGLDIYPEYHEINMTFNSIKKGSKTIAYIVQPVVTYKAVYSVYKTHADSKRGRRKEVTVDCSIKAYNKFYYENTKDKKIKYLGHSYDLSEFEEKVPLEPEFGVLVNDESIEKESAALALFKKLKPKKSLGKVSGVCYFGDWEDAVESSDFAIEIGVISIDKKGQLKVEVKNESTGKYAYGLIEKCT